MVIRLPGRGWLECLGITRHGGRGDNGIRVASGRGMLVGRCEGAEARHGGWPCEWG